MKNLPLAVKLIGSFVLVALLTVGVGVVGVKGIRDVDEQLMGITGVSLPAVESLLVVQ